MNCALRGNNWCYYNDLIRYDMFHISCRDMVYHDYSDAGIGFRFILKKK